MTNNTSYIGFEIPFPPTVNHMYVEYRDKNRRADEKMIAALVKAGVNRPKEEEQ